MKTRAAVLRDVGQDWEVIELDLDPPREAGWSRETGVVLTGLAGPDKRTIQLPGFELTLNQGYRDMLDGRNIRGLMIHDS